MQLRRTEKETRAEGYPVSARETDSETYSPPNQTVAPVPSKQIADSESVSMGYRIGEAVCVTFCLLIASGMSRTLLNVFISVIGNYVSSNGGLPRIVGLVSFILTAVLSVIVGVCVGLVAKRRTIVSSLVTAHIVNTLIWQAVMFTLVYPRFINGNWPAAANLLFWAVFSALTVALADIGIALYVARKFRKTV